MEEIRIKSQLQREKTLIERLLHPLHHLLQYQSTSGIIIFICVFNGPTGVFFLRYITSAETLERELMNKTLKIRR